MQSLLFSPYSTWIVYIDRVSHAAMSGRYLFEQTFHLLVHAMQSPHQSQLQILEKIAKRPCEGGNGMTSLTENKS